MYLNCHSYFSLKYGTIPIQKLVDKALEMGVSTLALTDINNTSGVFDFVKACYKAQIKPIVGVEFRNGDELKYICLAKNNEGFSEINEFLSEYLSKNKPFPTKAPDYQNAFTIYPLSFLETNPTLAESEFIAVRFWEISKLYRFRNNKAIEKLVAVQSLTFFDKIQFNLHRLLRAIDLNTLLSKLPKYAEANPSEWMMEESVLVKYFESYPEAVERSQWLSERCMFEFDYEIPKNKQLFTNTKADDFALLQKLAFDGMIYRYGEHNKVLKPALPKNFKPFKNSTFACIF